MSKRRGNGEGTISKRKDGNWVGQITIDIDPKTGQQHRKSIVRKTRKEVSEEIARLLSEKQSGLLVTPNKLIIESWLNHWLSVYKKSFIKPTTYDSYNNTISTHLIPTLGKLQLQKLTPSIIQKLVNDMCTNDLSPRTVQYTIYILSCALKKAVQLKYISHNPCTCIELPKHTRKPINVFTEKEMHQFITVLEEFRVETTALKTRHHPLYPAFLLQLMTGIRRGEVLGLTWEHIHLDQEYISIRQQLIKTSTGVLIDTPKTSTSIRDIPLPKLLVDILQNYTDNKTGFVFTTSKGKPVHPRSYQRTYDMLLKRAGLIIPGKKKPRIHDLRHNFATHLLASGVDIKTCSDLLGHADVRFTANIYTHPTMPMKRTAINTIGDMLDKKSS